MSVRGVPFGKYHLLERINVGGMAEVYRAKLIGVEGFEKQLAIKRILPSVAADQDFITMFVDEAKIAGQLTHGNIAQIFELGRIDDTYYIALEYLPGRDVRALFERLRRRKEIIPVDLACYVICRICEGLDYAHRKTDALGRNLGIIHRDVSPQNILVSYEGEVKLIDFGIAKAADNSMKTQAGILKGKFGYMSPEQVAGEVIDSRSDLFSVGIVLYELVTGERLFTGDSDYGILEKVRAANVPRPSIPRPDLDPAVEQVIMRALARNPADRYQHAGEIAADLQRYLVTQSKVLSRGDLAAYMKILFASEWEREKRLHARSLFEEDDETTHSSDVGPPGQPPQAPLRERVEDVETRVMPPPPPPGHWDDEPALPASRSDGRRTKLKSADSPQRITDMETRVQHAPPPVATHPPPVRSQVSPPAGPVRMPTAITNNLPRVRRPPPPVDLDDDDDKTVIDAGGAVRAGLDALPHQGAPIGEGGHELDTYVDPSVAYRPRKRANWTIVPVAALVAFAVGVVVLQLVAPDRSPLKRLVDIFVDPSFAYATLSVVTEPPDAEVLLNGELLRSEGTKPAVTGRAQAGVEHTLVVRKDGFRESTTKVTLDKDETRDVTITLRARSAVLTVDGTPSGARVFVDGREVGKLPAALATLGAGTYRVRVEQKCFETKEQTVTLGEFDKTVDFQLKTMPGACVAAARPPAGSAVPGQLRLTSRPPARVFIDGVDTGRTTPLLNFPIAPGKHSIRLVTEHNSSEEIEIDVRPGRSITRSVNIGGRR